MRLISIFLSFYLTLIKKKANNHNPKVIISRLLLTFASYTATNNRVERSVLLVDKNILCKGKFRTAWKTLGIIEKWTWAAKAESKPTNSSSPWSSQPQGYCKFYLCLLHEHEGFAHFIQAAHHWYFRTSCSLHKNCARPRIMKSHSNHVVSPKHGSRLGLETYQENSLSTRALSNWFSLHPAVIAVFSWVQTNPTKGETAPGFKITALKKHRCRA